MLTGQGACQDAGARRTTRRFDQLCTTAGRLTTPELHDLAAHIAARIEDREKPAEPPKSPKRIVVEERHTPTATLRLELVACGKGACKSCGGGRRPSHGPYWYACWKEDGRTRSSYIGKELPEARKV